MRGTKRTAPDVATIRGGEEPKNAGCVALPGSSNQCTTNESRISTLLAGVRWPTSTAALGTGDHWNAERDLRRLRVLPEEERWRAYSLLVRVVIDFLPPGEQPAARRELLAALEL